MISNLLPQRWWSLLVGEKQISGSRVLRETVQCADFNGTATTQGGRRTLLMSRASSLPPILPQFPSSQAGWFFAQHHEEHFTSSPLSPLSFFLSFTRPLPFAGKRFWRWTTRLWGGRTEPLSQRAHLYSMGWPPLWGKGWTF